MLIAARVEALEASNKVRTAAGIVHIAVLWAVRS